MTITIDPVKDRLNLAKHGLSFADFEGFDGRPFVTIDDRYDYGETRYRAFGRIGGAGDCLVFSLADGDVRLISWRRAHDKEMARYE